MTICYLLKEASTFAKNIPRMMTDVVPSPTSSSWVRLNSSIDYSHQNMRTVLENYMSNSNYTYKIQCRHRNWCFCFHKSHGQESNI